MKYYSQAGQDKWVLKNVFSFKKNGYFVEIGAFDGIYLSNTYLLEKKFQWNGLCIEGNQGTYKKLSQNRRSICVNACVGSAGGVIDFDQDGGTESGAWESSDPLNEVPIHPKINIIKLPTTPLSELLDAHQCPETIDYLSVDVEGMEEEVLKTFPFNKRKFICATIERPSESLRNQLRKEGYVLVIDQPGLDAFYIHGSFQSTYTDRILQNNRLDLACSVEKIAYYSRYIYKNGFRSFLEKIKYS
jgi:FkbM family methyltransferase